jgi:hypothetical protein
MKNAKVGMKPEEFRTVKDTKPITSANISMTTPLVKLPRYI